MQYQYNLSEVEGDRYNFIVRNCDLKNNSVLDIGAQNGQQLIAFLNNNFKHIHGIDKAVHSAKWPYVLLANLYLRNNLLIQKGKEYTLNEENELKFKNNNELLAYFKNENRFNHEIEFLRDRIKIKRRDFLKYNTYGLNIDKYEIIICSNVLHFYAEDQDEIIIEKLNQLIETGGYIYLKFHNPNRLKTYITNKTQEELGKISIDRINMTITDKTKGEHNSSRWHLFHKNRIAKYTEKFELIAQNEIQLDLTELILKKRNEI